MVLAPAFVSAAAPLLSRPPLSTALQAAHRAHRRLFATPRAAMSASLQSPVALSATLDVHIVPILSDNFSYLLHDKAAGTAALVDPAEPQPLLDLATRLSATVTTSLTTHHHWDHAGGNEQLAALVPGVDIVGSAYEPVPAATRRVESGDTHDVRGSSLVVRAMRTPCHTDGHVCYQVVAPGVAPAVFTGDTLFVAGCGKFFEGTASDMHASLNTTLAALPDDTLVFCGHEYTVSNLKFAASVDPANKAVSDKLDWAKARVEQGIPTVPTSIGEEKSTNPFMRVHVDDIRESLNIPDAKPEAVMKALRDAKDIFRPKKE